MNPFQGGTGVNGRREQFPPGLRSGLPPAASSRPEPLRRLLTLILVLTLAAVTLPAAPAAALSLPWKPHREAASQSALTSHSVAPLQEVSPPEAVQQLQTALAGRQPVVEILSPQDDSVLPAGPWSLKLRIHDWPLVDAGVLGVGPHVVVQLDQERPRIWTKDEGVMPELSPGSHRLTVYAALPWGEARKNPGAAQQIRLHRTAPNPLSLPALGSPQLLAVSPSGPAVGEPLLLDWLLLDAPLQDVGGSGIQWRLRLSINGDDVLLDQQSPLWLRGWRPGLNVLLLELLDARGEPLNPPFNSLVQEVDLSPSAVSPRWRGDTLSSAELAILLGEAPPAPPSGTPALEEPSLPPGTVSSPAELGSGAEPTPEEATAQAPLPAALQRDDHLPSSPSPGSVARQRPDDRSVPTPEPAARQPGSAEAVSESAPPALEGALSPASAPIQRPAWMADSLQDEATPTPLDQAGPSVLTEERSFGSPEVTPQATERDQRTQDGPLTSATPAPEAQPGADGGSATASPGAPPDSLLPPQPAPAPETPVPETGLPAPETGDGAAEPSREPPQQTMPPSIEPTAQAAAPAAPVPEDGDDRNRVRPSTALSGRARDLVNDDGTLRRPVQPGPLAGLRERLQR